MLNAENLGRNVVVIGASAGGVEALIGLFTRLPADLPAAVGVVLHRSPIHTGHLTSVLGSRAPLPVVEAVDMAPFSAGCIYVAPPDRHILLHDGRLCLNQGPKENGHRPAIDPLFRSSARCYGPRVVGVLLSGLGKDGVAGLDAITKSGGLFLVQDPDEATFPVMPSNAIRSGHVDGVLPLRKIAQTLAIFAMGGAVEPRSDQRGEPVTKLPGD
jgi:two-component system chemotaxis response regulator CheB